MWYKHVAAVVGKELCLPLEKTIWEINGRKKLGKPTGGSLDRGVDDHPSTIGIGWARVRVEYDENVPGRKS